MTDEIQRVDNALDMIGKTIERATFTPDEVLLRFTDGSVTKAVLEASEFDNEDRHWTWLEELDAHDLLILGFISHDEYDLRDRQRQFRKYEQERKQAEETIARLDRWFAKQPDYQPSET